MKASAFIKKKNGVETPKKCRWCLAACDDLEPLPKDESGQYKLQKLFDCTGFQADVLPGVPSFLCTKCESRLDRMYTFHWRCNRNIALVNGFTEKQNTVKNEGDISKDHLGHSAAQTVGTELLIKTEATTPDAAHGLHMNQSSCRAHQVNGTHECCGNQADDLFEAEENQIAIKVESDDVDEQDNLQTNPSELICQDREDRPVTTNTCVNDLPSESIQNGIAAVDAGKHLKNGRKRKNDQGKTLHRLRSYKRRSDQGVNPTELICQDREDRPVTTNTCVNDLPSESIQNGIAAVDTRKHLKVGRKRKNDQGKTLHRLRSYKRRSDQGVNPTELICQDREDRPVTTNTCVNDLPSESIQNGIAAVDAGKHLKVGRKRKNDQGKTLHRLRSYKRRSDQGVSPTELICQDREDRPVTTNTCVNDLPSESIKNGIAAVDAGKHLKVGRKRKNDQGKTLHRLRSYKRRSDQGVNPTELICQDREDRPVTTNTCVNDSASETIRNEIAAVDTGKHLKIGRKSKNDQGKTLHRLRSYNRRSDPGVNPTELICQDREDRPVTTNTCFNDLPSESIQNGIAAGKHLKVGQKRKNDQGKTLHRLRSYKRRSDQGVNNDINRNAHRKGHRNKQKHHCSHCSATYIHSSKLKIHIRTHTDEMLYACKICDRSFRSSQLLRKHSVRHNKDHKCPHCTSKFALSSELKVHIRAHTLEKPYVCKICDQSFSLFKNLLRHEKIHNKDEHHQCPHCPSKFTRLSYLNDHIRTHTGEKPFACKICEKAYYSLSALSIHSKIHKKDECHQCPHCPSKFAKLSNLKNHIRIHTGEKPFVCEVCDQAFRFSSNVAGHKKIHNKDKYHQCPHCPSRFRRLSNLNNHIRIHTGEKQFVCEVCGQAFRSLSNLAGHKKIHNKDQYHQCPHCPSKFPRLNTFKDHVRIHTGEKPFVCKICKKAFHSLSALLQHSKIHNKDQHHQCPHCPSKFPRLSHLNDHIRTHSGEKPFVCKFCKKAYYSKSALSLHSKIHKKGEYHQCPHCPSKFAQLHRLNDHIRTHTGEKPFVCKICKKAFHSSSALSLHSKSHKKNQ